MNAKNLRFTRLLIAAITCSASIALSEGAIPLNDSESLSFYGDFRARAETDFDSTKADGVSKRTDRTRFRIRARAGLSYKPNNVLSFNGRLRTGDRSAQQSPHITLWQNKGDEGRQGDARADKLYAQIANGDWTWVLGRNTRSHWQPHELAWDDDTYMDGVSLSYKPKGSKFEFNDYFAILPDGEDAFDRFDRSAIVGAQVKYTNTTDKGSLVVANTLSHLADDDDFVNTANDNLDMTLYMLNIQFTPADAPVSSSYGADLYYNFNDGPAGDPTMNDTTGFSIYGKWGGSDPGDWQFAYYYAHIEKWAVARFYAQDDYSRFGSATQTRSSDFSGHELRAVYTISSSTNLVGRLYYVDTISTQEDGYRFRLDLNTKF